MNIPTIRNPGPWSFGIFLVASALVVYLHEQGVPEAVKLGGQLITLAIATFAAKSALAKRVAGDSTPPPPARPPLETWPGNDDNKGAHK